MCGIVRGRITGVRTKAVQSNASVVDHEVNPPRVRLFQMLCEGLDASLVCDVELVILYLHKPAVCLQRFGLLIDLLLINTVAGPPKNLRPVAISQPPSLPNGGVATNFDR